MKTLTYQEIIKLNLCCFRNKEKKKRLHEISSRKTEWSALDILRLPDEEVSAEDKLWLVLRVRFIDTPILHEFACQCAERALAQIENPDPRSVAAIKTKRKWLCGEIKDKKLSAARHSARYAARQSGISAARTSAQSAAWASSWFAAEFASSEAAWYATKHVGRNEQIQILVDLLETVQR